MTSPKVNLRVHNYEDITSTTFGHILSDRYFCDVTLTCDDETQIAAHRVVLGTKSSALKTILMKMNHPHPWLYLRGVKGEELTALVSLIYLGHAEVSDSSLGVMLELAQEFALEGFDFETNYPENGIEREEIFPHSKLVERNISNKVETTDEKNYIPYREHHNAEEKVIASEEDLINDTEPNMGSSIKDNLSRPALIKPFSCENCPFTTNKQGTMNHHRKSKHEGLRHNCDHCEYKATSTSHLKVHKQNIHQGIKYPCDQCKYSATQLQGLKFHQDSIHKRIFRHPCDQCDYKARLPGALKIHKETAHQGIKYPCNVCDHEASSPNYLKSHIKFKHGGTKYSCDFCIYKTSYPSDLIKHKKTNKCARQNISPKH